MGRWAQSGQHGAHLQLPCVGSDFAPGKGLGASSHMTPAASPCTYVCLEHQEGLARLRPLPKVTQLLSGGSQIGTEPFVATLSHSAVRAARAGFQEATELELAQGTLLGWGRVCPALDPVHEEEECEGMTQRQTRGGPARPLPSGWPRVTVSRFLPSCRHHCSY